MRLPTALLLLACLLPAAHAEQRLVSLAAGPGALSQAIADARDGDVIEVLAGEYVGETAVVEGKRLTLRGVGERPVFKVNGKISVNKGILVVRHADVTVENLEFRGARGADADGAGIYLESGRLKVLNSSFYDNENGIATGNDAESELVVENSLFGMAPKVVGGLHHLLFVGRIGKFSVIGSRFHQGFEGHMVKSRARESRITYNLIYDGTRGGASYEVDLPNGGLAWLIGNVIGQATTTQNPVVVAYGAEGSRWDRNALYMAHNTLINHMTLPAWFLRVWRDRLPEAAEVVVVNNLTVGGGVLDWGASGRFAGNRMALYSSLRAPGILDFTLDADAWALGAGVDPREVGGQDLAPKFEFSVPGGLRPLPPRDSWTPGAYQR